MALQHYATRICDYLVQGADGKLTLAGIFTNIYGPTLPAARSMGVMVEFIGDVGDPFIVILDGPIDSGFQIVLAEGRLEEPVLQNKFEQWAALVAGMLNVALPEEGVYHIVLRSGDTLVHQYPIGVFLVNPQEVEKDG